MKRIHLIILYFFSVLLSGASLTLSAKNIGEWQVYPSYWNATQNVVAGKVVYSLMDGGLLRYDTDDKSVKLYNCLDDLNDVKISHIAYSQEAKKLLLVYDNQNIDLLDPDDNVFNVSSLKDKTISGKTVNNIFVQGTLAYLSTGFGFLVVEMKEGTILDTYKLGVDVQTMLVEQNTIWIAGNNGVYTSSLGNADLHNLSTWKCRHQASNWKQMVTFDGSIFMLHKNGIFRFTDKEAPQFKSGSFNFLKATSDGKMFFGNANEVNVYTTQQSGRQVTFSNGWNDISSFSNDTYWVSDGEHGLRNYRYTDGAFVVGSEVIQPNSPCRNLFYRMSYVPNAQGNYRLLVAGGTNTNNDDQTIATAMYYDEDKWTNLDESAASQLLPGVKQVNTTDLVQDPKDDTHFYAGTWRNGLKEYKDGKLIQIYTSDNSLIKSILPDNPYYHQYETATAAQYDAEGNLWFANQRLDTIIRYITPEGKWHSLYYDDIKQVKFIASYLFSSSGINFMVCQAYPTAGFFAFDTNGSLANVRDDRHRLITTIVNQDGTTYDPGECYCAVEDMDGRVWCGTQKGLFVIDNPASFFDDDFCFTQVKIARNDGSGLADYLLNGVSIRCIAVDGGNRKWIGTESNGVYLVSADGTELLHHFLADETPLLSDNVQSIAVNPATAEVMIGTDKGLCCYQGDATESESELDENKVLVYPNPVRPDYTGPIRIEGLTYNAEVKVCTATGQLVWSGVSNGGTCVWNGCNKQGRRVASGVYNIISSTEDGGQAVVSHVIVIR